MSNEELALEYQTTKSGKSFEKLLEQNRGLIMKLVYSFSKNANDNDDFYQESLLALERAAERFDPVRTPMFSTFLYVAIKNRLTLFRARIIPRVSFCSIEKIAEPVFHDKPAGRFDDLQYAMSKISPALKKKVMKVYFSREKLSRGDFALARIGRMSMRKFLN